MRRAQYGLVVREAEVEMMSLHFTEAWRGSKHIHSS